MCVCAKERKVQVTRLCCHLSLKPSPGTELNLYKNIIKIFTGVRETATQRVIERKRRRRQSGDEEILLLCLSLPKADNWRPHLDSGSKRRAEKERRRSDRGQRGERQRERIERGKPRPHVWLTLSPSCCSVTLSLCHYPTLTVSEVKPNSEQQFSQNIAPVVLFISPESRYLYQQYEL